MAHKRRLITDDPEGYSIFGIPVCLFASWVTRGKTMAFTTIAFVRLPHFQRIALHGFDPSNADSEVKIGNLSQNSPVWGRRSKQGAMAG